jgi:DNA-binding MarR family transcriptional regulator
MPAEEDNPAGPTAQLIGDFVGSAHVFALAVSHVMEQALLREVLGERLSSPQLKLLRLVSQFGDQTVSDVAAFLSLTSAAAGKAVDRLVRRGLLRRTKPEVGQRASQLALTAAGRRLLKDYQTARTRKLERIFRQVPAAQLRQSAQLLDRLAACIVSHSASPEQLCLACSAYLRQRCLLQEVVRRSRSYPQPADRNASPSAPKKLK